MVCIGYTNHVLDCCGRDIISHWSTAYLLLGLQDN